MPWAAAAAVVGAGISAHSSNKASKQQERMAREGMDVQESMFLRGLEETAPFREAGIGQLEAYQNLLTSQGRGEALDKYYKSGEFQGLQTQAEQGILRNRSATGNLRSGSAEAAIGQIAPQLGQNYLNQQTQNQLALINVGQGLSGQASNQANALGGQQSRLLQDVGSYRAGATLETGKQASNLTGELLGISQDEGWI